MTQHPKRRRIVVVDLGFGVTPSQTANIGKILKRHGFDHVVLKTVRDVTREIGHDTKASGMILSGGPLRLGKSVDLNVLNFALLCVRSFQVPTMGICFGCQLLNVLCGGTVRELRKYRPVCEEHRLELSGQVQRFCFHDVIDEVAPGFVVKDHILLGRRKKVICHVELDDPSDPSKFVVGYIFHPELSEAGLSCFRRFFDHLL